MVEYVYAPNVPQIEKEQTTDFGNDLTDSDGNALTVENVVVNNVYYNLPADSRKMRCGQHTDVGRRVCQQ